MSHHTGGGGVRTNVTKLHLGGGGQGPMSQNDTYGEGGFKNRSKKVSLISSLNLTVLGFPLMELFRSEAASNEEKNGEKCDLHLFKKKNLEDSKNNWLFVDVNVILLYFK
jgi:hypothetical protein